jgi:putative two-component system response regulator
MMKLTTEDSTEKDRELDKLTEELSFAYEELMLLYRTSESLASMLELGQISAKIVDDIRTLLQSQVALLLLLEEDGANTLKVQVAKGVGTDSLLHYQEKLGEGVIGKIVAEGKPQIVNRKQGAKYIAGLPWPAQSLICVPLLAKSKILGALVLSDKITGKSFSSSELKLASAIANQSAIALENARLFQQLREAYLEAIFMLAVACEAKDDDTGNHVRRIQHYSEELALALGFSKEEASHIGYSSILHDVGKIHIPDKILKKPGSLTPEEREIMKQHTLIGERILGDKEFFKTAREITRWHHENWAGNGYPDGLKGEEIPIRVRIVKLADIYDALSTKRCYKDAWPAEKVIKTLLELRGKELDPSLTDTFIDLWEKGIITKIQEALKG